MADEQKDYGHTITIAKKEAEKYVYAIIKSLQSQNYERYGEIKVQVTEANLPLAEYVLTLFKNLWIEETEREKKMEEIKKDDGTSYPLEVIEITLKKHPKLRH